MHCSRISTHNEPLINMKWSQDMKCTKNGQTFACKSQVARPPYYLESNTKYCWWLFPTLWNLELIEWKNVFNLSRCQAGFSAGAIYHQIKWWEDDIEGLLKVFFSHFLKAEHSIIVIILEWEIRWMNQCYDYCFITSVHRTVIWKRLCCSLVRRWPALYSQAVCTESHSRQISLKIYLRWSSSKVITYRFSFWK